MVNRNNHFPAVPEPAPAEPSVKESSRIAALEYEAYKITPGLIERLQRQIYASAPVPTVTTLDELTTRYGTERFIQGQKHILEVLTYLMNYPEQEPS